MSDLEKQKLEREKQQWIKPQKKEKIANSNDFIFDRKTFKIIKKEQLPLL